MATIYRLNEDDILDISLWTPANADSLIDGINLHATHQIDWARINTSGFSGAGVSGYSGYSGTGTSGYSGYSGQNGSAGAYAGASPATENVGGLTAGYVLTGKTYEQLFEKILVTYQSPAFSSFSISGQSTTVEVGTTISGFKTFTWGTTNSSNVSPNTLVVRDFTGASDLGTSLANDGSESLSVGSVQKLTATSNTWRITGTNTELGTFQRDFAVSWQWMRYYGESASAGPLDEANTKALRVGGLASSFAGTYVFNAGGYKYLAYPVSLGTATSFKDQSTNLDVPFQTVYTVSVTNSLGVTVNYNVHRTTNVLGAAINIVVS
jgi:hypothetical protein